MKERKKLKVVLGIIGGFVACAMVLPGFVGAGDLEPPAGPGDAASALYTLEDIYDRLNDNTTATKRVGGFTEPLSGPGSTGHDLDDIYEKALPTRVEKTGQTKCYDGTSEQPCPVTGFPGQDGDHQKGVSWPSPRFTDNTDGTVTDNLTGLIWLTNANCPGTNRQWSTALTDVAQLNTDGTMNGNNCNDTSNGGVHQTDWRLPNVKELQSLIDFGNVSPALPDGHPFSGVVTSSYWSSTTVAGNTSSAWHVYMTYGNVYSANKTTNTYYVWPVRGGL